MRHTGSERFAAAAAAAAVVMYLLAFVDAADQHGLSCKYLDRDQKTLKIKCGGSSSALKEFIISIVIYNGTSLGTLAQVKVGQCPVVEDPAIAENVYTLGCSPLKPGTLRPLEVIMSGTEPTDARTIGCNITKRDKLGDLTRTTWAISLDKNGTSHMTKNSTTALTNQSEIALIEAMLSPSARASTADKAASGDKSAKMKAGRPEKVTADSYLPIYAMGFAVVSLALGLASALCYIGMNSLKARRCATSEAEEPGSGDSENEDRLCNEVVNNESENGQDTGCDRSLACPAGALRRPSYQDYSEPLSPTPSALSDFVGIDFMQLLLSDKSIVGPIVKLPKNKASNTTAHFWNLPHISHFTPQPQETIKHIYSKVSGEHFKYPSEKAEVVLELPANFNQESLLHRLNSTLGWDFDVN